MRKRFLRHFMKDEERIRTHPGLRWLGPVIQTPDLWHVNRRSVAGAVAIGAFFAFILPFAQFLAAAVVAVYVRVNLPIAMTATLITNPFTVAPCYYLAYRIGALVMGEDTQSAPAAETMFWGGGFPSLGAVLDTLMGMGQPLIVGLAIMAVATAAGGYLMVHLLWRLPGMARLWRLRQGRNRHSG